MSKIPNFVDWLTAQVGSIYVWGAQGETATETLIRKMETSQTNVNRALTLYKKRIAEGVKPKMYDCSGLIVCYFLRNSLINSDTTAAGLYEKCRAIKQSELAAGDLVFHHNGTKIHHVGVYIGDSMVIHAKGRDVGVVKEKFSANDWNKFGRFEPLQEKEEDKVIITKGMKSDSIKKLQAALNELGYACGAADGIVGDKTIKAIQEFAQAHTGSTTVVLPGSLPVTVQVGNKNYKGEVK